MCETTTKHRSAPAILACLCYATCSVAITLTNKHIFSHSLNYPWTLLGIQSISVSIILILFQLLNGARVLSLTLIKQIFLPCLVFTVYIFSNSQALRYVSLPVLSVIKSLAPMGIAAIEHIAFGDTISNPTIGAMIMIVTGNAVTMANDVEFSFQGYGWSFLNVALNIAYVVSLRFFLSDNFSPIEKAIHSNLTAATLMLPVSVASGETTPFLQEIRTTDMTFRIVFVVSCFFAAGIGASVFWVIQTSSGSTLSFVGACDKFLVVILGGILFKARITPAGWVSIALGVMAGAVFTVAKASDRTQDIKNMISELDGKEDGSSFISRFFHASSQEEQDTVDVSSEEENDELHESLVSKR